MSYAENISIAGQSEKHIPGHLPRAKVISRHSSGPHGIPYFVYVPESAQAGAPLFVSVHGITRNAAEHAIRFQGVADEHGAVLVAPLFSSDVHHMYQQFGASIDGQRSDRSLMSIVDDVGRLTGCDNASMHLFGFSGGAQFAHRFTMAYPQSVQRLAIAAAGWYSLPTTKQRFPNGLRKRSHIQDITFDPDLFLRIPTKVVVGSRDILRDESLRKTARLDRMQGSTRVERGRCWVNRMNKEAASRRLPQVFKFELLADAGHSFTQSMNECGLAKAVGSFLFESKQALETRTGDRP